MKKILLTGPIHDIPTSKLGERFEVVISPDENKETLLDLVKDVDAMVLRLAKIDKEILDEAKKLKIIAKYGVGVDNVDLERATANNIYVVTTGNANSLSVAEHTIAGILGVFKRIVTIDNALRSENNWSIKEDNKSLNFTGKTLGLVGVGRIGSEVARMAKNGFSMEVMAYDPYANKEMLKENGIKIIDDIKELFKTSDIISLHVPLTNETEGLISKELLGLMKPNAVFANFARGEIVDEEYLYEILRDKKIFGAALDSFSQEPLPKDSPFYTLDNVILSPHCATFTDECRSTMGMALVEDIYRVFDGLDPIRIVNKELLKK